MNDVSEQRSAGRLNRLPAQLHPLAIALAAGALIAGLLAAFSPGSFWNGVLAAGPLSFAAIYLLIRAWRWAGAGRVLGWMVALAFLLRLLSGAGISLALPVWGYPEPEQQAGYLFKDASARDTQAWELAGSDAPLWESFRSEFASDQYGGLLALSALVYRYLSPDAHRPFLIFILGSFFAALGVPFLVAAARLRFTARIATLAGWIYALYPEAIFYSSGQLREPFLVGMAAAAFWAVLAWDWHKPRVWLALALSLIGMALISSRVAAAAGGFLGLLFLLEHILSRPERRWKLLGGAALAAGLVLVLLFSWEWFHSASGYDAVLTMRGSGQVTTQIRQVGEQYILPFLVVYGIAQPVLPAAIADPSIPLWHTLAVFRAAGWYALAPFLIYGLFTFWKEERPRRRLVIWLLLAVFAWMVIAAIRGGGDANDNPRYRSLFIPWMALLASWSINWALAHRDPWLWRWIAVEGIFLAFFTHWYLSRYYVLWTKLPFWTMTGLILALSALVMLGGWVWDRRRSQKSLV